MIFVCQEVNINLTFDFLQKFPHIYEMQKAHRRYAGYQPIISPV